MTEPLYRTLKKAAEERPRDLTSGSTFRHVLRLGLWSMFALALQASYDLVDMAWIGRLEHGSDAMAAVTIYGTLFALILVLNQIADIGAGALIARYCGAKHFKAARTVTGQAWTLKLLLSLPVAVVGIIFIKDIFERYGAQPGVTQFGVQYSIIMLAGLPLMFWGLTLSTAFRAAGDVKKPLYMAAVSVGVNIVLDPILIFGLGPVPALGVQGAAIASVFSQALLVVIGLVYLLSPSSHLRVKLTQLFSPGLRWSVKILRIGTPAAIGDLLRTMVFIVTAWVVLMFGAKTMAAFGVGIRLLVGAVIPIYAIGTAISALVGQNLGARKPARATRSVINGTFICLAISFLIGLVSFLIPQLIMHTFTPDPEVVEIGVPLIRMGSFAVVAIAVATALASAFWGAGDAFPPMVAWIVATAGVQLPILLLSVFYFQTDVTYVWFSITAGSLAGMMILAVWLARGSWLKKKL